MTPSTPEPGPGPHARFLDVAYEMFSTRPYQKISVEAIAREAGVSKSLLFYHFGSKEELARKALLHGFDRELAEFGPIEDLDEEMVRLALPSFLQLSLNRIQVIHTFTEVVDIDDPEDELVKAMRHLYDYLVGIIGRFLETRGERYPYEKAMLITLAVDLFGWIEKIKGEEPDLDRYVNAILDMMGMEVEA